MPQTQLNQHGVYGADLDTVPSTNVAMAGRFDVVFPIRLKEGEGGEPLDHLSSRLWPGEPLQQFLQHKAGCENLVGALQRAA